MASVLAIKLHKCSHKDDGKKDCSILGKAKKNQPVFLQTT
jgi:hypothetical protein